MTNIADIQTDQLQEIQVGAIDFSLGGEKNTVHLIAGFASDAYFGAVDAYKDELSALLSNEQPFIAGERQDGKKYSIFVTPANSPYSSPAKAHDASVRETDPDWMDSRDKTAESLIPLQENSYYITYIDTTDPQKPRVAGTIMYADANKGPAETIEYFKTKNPDKELPEEFKQNLGRKLWDIVSVMVGREDRDGITSAYLYRALYAKALEEKGRRSDMQDLGSEDKMTWITCLSGKAFKSIVTMLGVAFRKIEGLDPEFEVPDGERGKKANVKPVPFWYCTLDVDEIYPFAVDHINKREARGSDSQLFMAQLSRIALVGYASDEVLELPYAKKDPVAA